MPEPSTHTRAKNHTMINFLSGVLQGCPASAFLFNNALDPFLTNFDKILRANDAGIVRACADDIGISIRKLKHLHLIYPIYQECKELAGLALKPSKCVLVPLCEYTAEIQDSIEQWIAKNIPLWNSFKIEPCAKLLGFYIGPAAGSKMWNGVIAKYNNRILEMKRCHSPLAIFCIT